MNQNLTRAAERSPNLSPNCHVFARTAEHFYQPAFGQKLSNEAATEARSRLPLSSNPAAQARHSRPSSNEISWLRAWATDVPRMATLLSQWLALRKWCARWHGQTSNIQSCWVRLLVWGGGIRFRCLCAGIGRDPNFGAAAWTQTLCCSSASRRM